MVAAFETLFGAVFLGIAGALGALAGEAMVHRLPRLDDAPRPHRAPVPLLVAGCAVIGGLSSHAAAAPWQLPLLAIVCGALVASWITDARTGIVPDAFTVLPLA